MSGFSPIQIDRFYMEQWTKLERASVETKPKERVSYYNNNKIYKDLCMYDSLFHPEEGYDQSMHRCDRLNWRKIDEGIFKEERRKSISVLTSFDYGYSTEPLEFPGMFKRKLNARADFYTNGRWNPKLEDTPMLC